MPIDELCEITPGRVGEDAQYWLDSSRIEKDIGWKPEITLQEGAKDMVEWGRKYLDQIKDAPLSFTLRA